jgi:hypothetical protein
MEEVGHIPTKETVKLGNGTALTIAAWLTDGTLHVAIELHGYYSFTHCAHYSYVMEKLGIKYEADAKVVADAINLIVAPAKIELVCCPDTEL